LKLSVLIVSVMWSPGEYMQTGVHMPQTTPFPECNMTTCTIMLLAS